MAREPSPTRGRLEAYRAAALGGVAVAVLVATLVVLARVPAQVGVPAAVVCMAAAIVAARARRRWVDPLVSAASGIARAARPRR